MLIELVGQPASGKTRIADELARLSRGWTRISELRRRLGAALRLGIPDDSPAAMVIDGICRDYCGPGIRRLRRSALLRNSRRLALLQQKAPSTCFSDQLFLHGLYCTVGPQRNPTEELLKAIEWLIVQTYSAESVAFIHVKPATSQWHEQLRRTPQGRTRFSVRGDARLMEALKDDTLYQAGIIDTLKAKGYWVLDVQPGPSSGPPEIAEQCFKAISSRLRT